MTWHDMACKACYLCSLVFVFFVIVFFVAFFSVRVSIQLLTTASGTYLFLSGPLFFCFIFRRYCFLIFVILTNPKNYSLSLKTFFATSPALPHQAPLRRSLAVSLTIVDPGRRGAALTKGFASWYCVPGRPNTLGSLFLFTISLLRR